MKDKIAVARGLQQADLVIKNAKIVNVFAGTIEIGDIAIASGEIVGIGQYESDCEIDANGKFVLPGLIDTHVHIESSMLCPEEFLALVIPKGVTTFIADPHEIANVCGEKGVDYMVKASANMPADVKFMLPSCVPATPFETAGAVIDAEKTSKMIRSAKLFGLGEMMNFPGVIQADAEVLGKIQAAKSVHKHIDGHAPGVSGNDLNAYILTGIGTDHECTTTAEMKEKLNRGMYIQIRQGSATRDLETLLPAVTAKNLRRMLFCTDDRHVDDLLEQGQLDYSIRLAVKCGMDPIDAITIATLNAAECYGLKDRGAIAPGYRADLVIADDLKNFTAETVIQAGKVVAQQGKLVEAYRKYRPKSVLHTVHLTKPLTANDFEIPVQSNRLKVMRVIPKSVITNVQVETVPVRDGKVDVSALKGINLLAVVERHHNTGRIGHGLIANYGIQNGAVATTVAHDSHNIIVVGSDTESMAKAANLLQESGGGIAVVHATEQKSYVLPLSIAGLMSTWPAEKVYKSLKKLLQVVYKMGVNRELEPFMTLSFLALPVIPYVKITDLGLFDLAQFRHVALEE